MKTGNLFWLKTTLAASLGALATGVQSPATLAGEHGVGNGGDAVYCRPSGQSKFSGYYSLDYLLTYDTSNGNADIPEDAGARIYPGLLRFRAEYPILMTYQKATRIAPGKLAPEGWQEASFGLIDLEDEQITRKLPENCYQRQPGSNRPMIIQAVRRTAVGAGFKFEYDPKILAELAKRPLQLSFLLTHEWGWGLTQDVHALREFNRYLHSNEFREADLRAFAQTLNRLLIAQPELPAEGAYRWPWTHQYGSTHCDIKITRLSQTGDAIQIEIIVPPPGEGQCFYGRYERGRFECSTVEEQGETVCAPTNARWLDQRYVLKNGVLRWGSVYDPTLTFLGGQ